MAENNSILDKLEGLVSRYEEVGTLITDPNVISDQKRYVKLTKEYKDLGDIMKARKEYMDSLQTLQDAKEMLATEDDPEMKEMAREEMAAAEKHIPEMEERIKLLLVPADPGRRQKRHYGNTGRNGRRRSRTVRRRLVPHVHQILRNERLEDSYLQLYGRSCGRL